MENRKSKLSKILSQFDALVDEKLTLEDNLGLLFNQLYPYIDHARKIENGGQKDLNEILKYELKILKKLTDLNTDLEGFIDEKAVSSLQGTTKSLDCTKFELSDSKSEMGIAAQQQEFFTSEQSLSNELPTELNEPSTMIIPFEFSMFEMKNEIPENDIESLRNCLKNFSAKLGLNQQSFSNMEDYYEKSSASCIKEEQGNPSPVVISEVTPDVLEEVVTSEVEIPVRDTCILLDELHSNTEKINQCDEAKSESIEISSKISNIFSVTSTASIDHLEKESYDKNYCTALTKLNSYRSKKLNSAIVKTVQLPDISLKPAKASNFSKNNPQSKKNKKKEIVANIPSKSNTIWSGNREKEDVFYEPDRKMTPMVGDECAFSHIESPSEFYVHVNDEETAMIDSLTEQINEYFNGSVSTYRSKQSACSEIGKFCFSFIPDYIGWFRVEVLDWYLDDDSMDVLVQLVDYGNKRKTSYKDLRKMVKGICDIPLLAIRCHFPLMYPYGSTRTNKITVWPDIAVEALIGLSKNNGQQNMFKIMYALEESNSVAIDLLSPFEEGGGNTVGQILLDMGLAVQIFDEMNY